MGGFFAVASKESCVMDLFFGTDYHSHLGTKRGGMAIYGPNGFNRAIHNIQNSPFRTKFERDVEEFEGNLGIGCISDFEPQPLLFGWKYLNFSRSFFRTGFNYKTCYPKERRGDYSGIIRRLCKS